jgi:asparagine synthase (glutamine-hydrolysing)
MCGICGKLQFRGETPVDSTIVMRMVRALSHRGPDGHGTYISGPVGLGHTRLSIIDLTTGDQPISNEDNTIWLVYNGEIYNFAELRDELLKHGHVFRSRSDTEVIVHLYEQYGVDCLSRLRGMFAFALWDGKKQALFLARDRLGIKPLYYADTGNALVFGSEIKALLADPDVQCKVELQSVDKFLTHFCLPGRETLWEGIYKLEPGFYMVSEKGRTTLKEYWDLEFRTDRRWRSFDEAAEAVYDLTNRTVHDHMISDVPVGFLLSGGVDSTVVLSCAATETRKRIQTFTVGFGNGAFEDERPYARLASERFGSEQHEVTFGPKEFWDFLPSLVWSMEEPICDPPAVSLHYVSKLARQHVKVLLSGEGGDEAFGGYYTYRNFAFLERAKKLSRPFGALLSDSMSLLGRTRAFRKLGSYSRHASAELRDYYYSRAATPYSFFNENSSTLYSQDFNACIDHDRSLDVTRALFSRVKNQPPLHQMQYIDTKTSLPDDLLIKADRVTMGNSLELRVPFLDHELVQFAATLPTNYKVRGLATKRILKRAFGKKIPREIIQRRKAGFPLPFEAWMKTDLKGRIGDVLLSKSFLDRGYFKKSGIEKLLALLEAGQPLAKEVFSLLTLELIHQKFVDRQGLTE